MGNSVPKLTPEVLCQLVTEGSAVEDSKQEGDGGPQDELSSNARNIALQLMCDKAEQLRNTKPNTSVSHLELQALYRRGTVQTPICISSGNPSPVQATVAPTNNDE